MPSMFNTKPSTNVTSQIISKFIEDAIRIQKDIFSLLSEENLNINELMLSYESVSSHICKLTDTSDGVVHQLGRLIQIQTNVLKLIVDKMNAPPAPPPPPPHAPTKIFEDKFTSLTNVSSLDPTPTPTPHAPTKTFEDKFTSLTPVASFDSEAMTKVHDATFTKSLDNLKHQFPLVPQERLYRVLENTGGEEEQAVNLLIMEGLQWQNEEESVSQTELKRANSLHKVMVKQIFPHLSEEAIQCALSNTNNSPEGAIDLLLVQGAAWVGWIKDNNYSKTAVTKSTPTKPQETQLAQPTRISINETKTNKDAVAHIKEVIPGANINKINKALESSHGEIRGAISFILKDNSEVDSLDSIPLDATTVMCEEKLPYALPNTYHKSQYESVMLTTLRDAYSNPEQFFQIHTKALITTKQRIYQALGQVGAIPTREAKIMYGKNQIEKRIFTMNMNEEVMEDDGNCQFRAFSHQLFRTQAYHFLIRKHVVQHLLNHPDSYSFYFEDINTYKSYAYKLSRDGEWGDEITLKAFCDAFQVVVHVVLSTDSRWYLTYVPSTAVTKHVFLTYIAPIHYNSLIHNNELPKSQKF